MNVESSSGRQPDHGVDHPIGEIHHEPSLARLWNSGREAISKHTSILVKYQKFIGTTAVLTTAGIILGVEVLHHVKRKHGIEDDVEALEKLELHHFDEYEQEKKGKGKFKPKIEDRVNKDRFH